MIRTDTDTNDYYNTYTIVCFTKQDTDTHDKD